MWMKLTESLCRPWSAAITSVIGPHARLMQKAGVENDTTNGLACSIASATVSS